MVLLWCRIAKMGVEKDSQGNKFTTRNFVFPLIIRKLYMIITSTHYKRKDVYTYQMHQIIIVIFERTHNIFFITFVIDV